MKVISPEPLARLLWATKSHSEIFASAIAMETFGN